MSKFKEPSDVIIEKTAGEMAGIWYDAARSSGMTMVKLQGEVIDLRKFKSTKWFARLHLEKFIPAAVEALTTILGRPDTPDAQKEIIYQALMERVNDQDLDLLSKTAGLPDFQNSVLYKSDQEKPKPVIVNTPRIEDFKFDSTRKH